MTTLVTVREYARLTSSTLAEPSLDRRQVSQSAFDWLCRLSSKLSQSGASLVELEDRKWLRLDNYVGVIETPCGTRVEILPKHLEEGESLEAARSLLIKMIRTTFDLPARDVGPSSLQKFNAPLNEWVMRQFLVSLDHLIKRGIRSEYQLVEDEQRFLRGQLSRARQMRQRLDRQHFFHIRHDVFSANRSENRLLKLAAERVCRATQVPSNWRLSHELREYLSEVDASREVAADFERWRDDRLMAHYQGVKPWCELILGEEMPTSVAGTWEGISLLFPMEKLFERYVASCLRRTLRRDARLRTQPKQHFLCEHDDRSLFCLQPDIVIDCETARWVLDTKWKLVDSANSQNNYNLKQADFYQLFAYGKTYLQNSTQGNLALVYPQRQAFKAALRKFTFADKLDLWVLPFDLDAGVLIDAALCDLPVGTPTPRCQEFRKG
ncbi:5-methylcytosine-specific restriction enzyme subunit McrC [Bradyrhizobium sp. Rc2d]|uniref:McrC family protein n=1 Tax=Bradyrhizobium sp. Rc2d TaxID=1855321 RepID=UPI000880CE6D|nr:McrC family protein [Bradyrhizobium sp. Rc2d]SDK00221.1 5-methylcytosine-specific restriction enzyme subunit McrC [Bradyrhizobium sp. Rc2d]